MKRLFAFLVLVLLTLAYLYPGSAAMIVGSTTEVMSDDTDVSTLPFAFSQYDRILHEDPARFLYGSVYIDRYDPEQGTPSWVSLSERWLAVGLDQILPVEQVSTALVLIYLLASGVAMFLLCHVLRWRDTIGYGLALAWCFSFYALARAQVHTDFTALYHIPLTFAALVLIARAKSWLSLSLPAMYFLLAATVPHYYLITTAFLLPLILIFFFLQPEVRGHKLRSAARLIFTAIPVVALMGFNFARPVPPEAKAKLAHVLPASGDIPQGMKFHPFLTYYAARPIDYLTGPLWPKSFDVNPWRADLDKAVQAELMADGRRGNFHERTNGVRWSIWFLALCSVVSVIGLKCRRHKFDAAEKYAASMLAFFFLLGLAGFLLSLAPSLSSPGLSPSYWLYKLVPQIRVPSRAGMYVSFSLLMMVGYWLDSTLAPYTLRKMVYLPLIFPLAIFLEFPPLSRVQMAPMRPQVEALSMDHGACGAGLYFPFVNNSEGVLDYYYFLQRMRGTNCQILNTLANPVRANWLSVRFPPTANFIKDLNQNQTARVELLRIAKCVPLSWIVFDSHTPKTWAETLCRDLGWKMNPDASCVAPDHSVPLQHYPDDCG